jgi:hypothetical protein
MPRQRKLINKEATKKLAGKCYFCEVSDYDCLHCHRITPGEDGGIYTDFNTVVVCANHHSMLHSDQPQIILDRKYMSTTGRWILHYWENGVEKWL